MIQKNFKFLTKNLHNHQNLNSNILLILHFTIKITFPLILYNICRVNLNKFSIP